MTDRLHAVIAAACPIDGVSVGTPGVAASVRIDYRPEATAAQRTAAQNALASFDWSPQAHDAWLDDRQPQRKGLRQAAAQAVADNDAFLALANPSNAQVAAQVKALTRQNSALIRRVIQLN